ncbi:hypothetical protein V2W45_1343344 [Cenococcum geophilum]
MSFPDGIDLCNASPLAGLKWFNEVAEGAGLKARLILFNYLTGNEYESIRCTWLHRMQKRGDEAEEVQDTAKGALKETFTRYPHLRSTYKNRTV